MPVHCQLIRNNPLLLVLFYSCRKCEGKCCVVAHGIFVNLDETILLNSQKFLVHSSVCSLHSSRGTSTFSVWLLSHLQELNLQDTNMTAAKETKMSVTCLPVYHLIIGMWYLKCVNDLELEVRKRAPWDSAPKVWSQTMHFTDQTRVALVRTTVSSEWHY